ncbi:hypothetical protein BD779DRAFT_1562493 [Infundibulicybe gibba]|nr:hypothetical protein BD779DRAFT_1562493 [Infundibulicybe gibba]
MHTQGSAASLRAKMVDRLAKRRVVFARPEPWSRSPVWMAVLNCGSSPSLRVWVRAFRLARHTFGNLRDVRMGTTRVLIRPTMVQV